MWFRTITLIIVYLLLLGFVFLHIRKLEKNKEKSTDSLIKATDDTIVPKELTYDNKIFYSNLLFLLSILFTIIIFTLIPALSGYTVVGLIVVFLFGGLIVGNINAKGDFKTVLISFKKGVISVLPAILLVLMASTIKYILVEGQIIDTITNYMIEATSDKPTILAIFLILILVVFDQYEIKRL
jgi:uncharacterized ion transporter superfamily protein YfcC